MDRKELVKKLELASLALSNDSMVPILQCFMFTGATVDATSEGIGISITCPTGMAFALNGKVLLGLLSNSVGDSVDFIMNDEIEVKAGRSRFKLPFLPHDAFAPMGGKMKQFFSLPLTNDAITGIEACLMTACRDLSQKALIGLTLKRGRSIQLYGVDSDALTRFDTQAKTTPGEDVQLPHEFFEAVVKIAKAEGLAEDAKLYIGNEWAKAVIKKGYEVHGQILANSNPLDHEDVIKKSLKDPIWVGLPEELSQALSRAEVIAKPESATTVLTVEDGKLKLLTETHMGVVRDSVGLSGHPDVTADVSAELMQRTISICKELAITDRCVAYRSGDTLFQIISNVTR